MLNNFQQELSFTSRSSIDQSMYNTNETKRWAEASHAPSVDGLQGVVFLVSVTYSEELYKEK